VETLDPATGEAFAEVAVADESDVDRAVRAASEAFPDWRDTDPVERGQTLHRVAELVREHADELADLESRDQGKPLSQARSDMLSAARYFEYYAGAADKLEGRSVPVGTGQVDYVVREPYGVSAQIIPWNFRGTSSRAAWRRRSPPGTPQSSSPRRRRRCRRTASPNSAPRRAFPRRRSTSFRAPARRARR